MMVLRLCNVFYHCTLFLVFVGCNVVIKEVKRLVLRPLKTVVRESSVDLIFCSTDLPH